jgi:hypothetical protein
MERRLTTFLVSIALVQALTVTTSTAPGNPVDITERARGAHRVVVATASNVSPHWQTNSFGDQLIVSQVGLQVQETIKGAPASFVWLDLEGGTIGDLTLHVSDLPDLKPGERGVFFLDETPNGSHVPHLRGLGILKLDTNDHVRGSSLNLSDVRRMAQSAGR